MAAFRKHPIAKHSIATVSSKLIAAWRDSRLREASSGTVLGDMQLLNHVFAVAIRDWGMALHSTPMSHVRKPPAGKSRGTRANFEHQAGMNAGEIQLHIAN